MQYIPPYKVLGVQVFGDATKFAVITEGKTSATSVTMVFGLQTRDSVLSHLSLWTRPKNGDASWLGIEGLKSY